MKDRIKQLMLSQHMTQQSFADFLGVSSASLSSLFNGRSNPTLTYVDAIKKKLPSINLSWLLYGEGPMFNTESSASAETPDQDSQTAQQPGDMFVDFHFPTPQQRGSSTRSNHANLSPNSDNSTLVKYLDKPQRQITEIRIFFDDQTYESFVPKK